MQKEAVAREKSPMGLVGTDAAPSPPLVRDIYW